MARIRPLLAGFALAGCTVVDQPYPITWDPLGPPPAPACSHFAGSYADRGERTDEMTSPSLTRALFGDLSEWEGAKRVELALPEEGRLEIAVLGEAGPIFSRSLSARSGDFSCADGKLRVRSKRWLAGYIISGRQNVTLELHRSGRHLVAQVDEFAYGVLFIIWPVAGTATHWYRFPRL